MSIIQLCTKSTTIILSISKNKVQLFKASVVCCEGGVVGWREGMEESLWTGSYEPQICIPNQQ